MQPLKSFFWDRRNQPTTETCTDIEAQIVVQILSDLAFIEGALLLIFLHIKYLKFLGDEIPKEDVAKLLDELCDKEDDDGYIPYVPFLERLCGKV